MRPRDGRDSANNPAYPAPGLLESWAVYLLGGHEIGSSYSRHDGGRTESGRVTFSRL